MTIDEGCVQIRSMMSEIKIAQAHDAVISFRFRTAKLSVAREVRTFKFERLMRLCAGTG